MAMPPQLRDYLYAGLLGATPVLLVVGAIMLLRAGSFQGYIAALMVLTLAACSFLGARELKPAQRTDMRALLDYFGRKKTDQDGPSTSNGPS